MENKTKPLSYTYFLHLFVDSCKRCRQTQPKQSKSAAAFWPRGNRKSVQKSPPNASWRWVTTCFNSPVLFWEIKIKKKRKKPSVTPLRKKWAERKVQRVQSAALTDADTNTRSSAKLMTARAATFIHCKTIHTYKAGALHHLQWAAETFPIDCIYLSSTCADCYKPSEKKGKTGEARGGMAAHTERRPK